MQAVHFTYKNIRYCVYGWWGISVENPDGTDADIDDGKLKTKADALNAKVFDNGKKALIDIYTEITDVEFDL